MEIGMRIGGKRKSWKRRIPGSGILIPCCVQWIIVFVGVFHLGSSGGYEPSEAETLREYACFNTIFEISCSLNEIIIFERARYGRNDSTGAVMCDLPFTRNCDVDVQYSLSRACGGKRKCSIAVNTAFFGDPCGYEEFLKVDYLCIPGTSIYRRCPESYGVQFFDRGYLASPNYPGKYYLDVECRWHLSVQPLQNLRITLYDFELDVKLSGTCHDFLDITTGNKTYFRECGTLGKQVIDVNASSVVIWFRTGQTSLTQRGFILFVEAIGKGCELIGVGQSSTAASASYFLENDVLFANVSCEPNYEFDDGEPLSTRLIRCQNDSWSADLPSCLPSIAVTTLNSPSVHNSTSTNDFPMSFYSIFLGVLASVLLIMLLILLIAVCCNRRQRLVNRKRDEWRIVVNNLQDNVINDATMTSKAVQLHDFKLSAKTSHACEKRHNTKRPRAGDDAWLNRNLLFAVSDVNDEADDISHMTLYETTFGTRRARSFARCAICQSETRNVGSYVGFLLPCPSSCDGDSGIWRPEVVKRRRAQSEPLSGSCVAAKHILFSFYSSPDLTGTVPTL